MMSVRQTPPNVDAHQERHNGEHENPPLICFHLHGEKSDQVQLHITVIRASWT